MAYPFILDTSVYIWTLDLRAFWALKKTQLDAYLKTSDIKWLQILKAEVVSYDTSIGITSCCLNCMIYHNGISVAYTTHLLMSLILGARIDNSSWRVPGMGLSGPGFKSWFGLPSVYPFHSMHCVISDQLLFFLAGETPTRGQWINLRFVCSNVIAFQGGRKREEC